MKLDILFLLASFCGLWSSITSQLETAKVTLNTLPSSVKVHPEGGKSNLYDADATMQDFKELMGLFNISYDGLYPEKMNKELNFSQQFVRTFEGNHKPEDIPPSHQLVHPEGGKSNLYDADATMQDFKELMGLFNISYDGLYPEKMNKELNFSQQFVRTFEGNHKPEDIPPSHQLVHPEGGKSNLYDADATMQDFKELMGLFNISYDGLYPEKMNKELNFSQQFVRTFEGNHKPEDIPPSHQLVHPEGGKSNLYDADATMQDFKELMGLFNISYDGMYPEKMNKELNFSQQFVRTFEGNHKPEDIPPSHQLVHPEGGKSNLYDADATMQDFKELMGLFNISYDGLYPEKMNKELNFSQQFVRTFEGNHKPEDIPPSHQLVHPEGGKSNLNDADATMQDFKELMGLFNISYDGLYPEKMNKELNFSQQFVRTFEGNHKPEDIPPSHQLVHPEGGKSHLYAANATMQDFKELMGLFNISYDGLYPEKMNKELNFSQQFVRTFDGRHKPEDISPSHQLVHPEGRKSNLYDSNATMLDFKGLMGLFNISNDGLYPEKMNKKLNFSQQFVRTFEGRHKPEDIPSNHQLLI